uniref:Uncharacterized protein n=1 Tax=Megaselia scalaris TaxID=36166 RepID=T1GK70_MEGSC
MVTIDFKLQGKKPSPFTTKTFRRLNPNLFCSLVSHELTSLDASDAESATETHYKELERCRHFPANKKVRTSSVKWISLHILNEMKEREKLLRK